MIHEEICTYEVCKLAKEKGFNCKVYNYYQATKHYCETLRGIELHSECWKLETDDCYSRYNKSSEDVVSAPTQSLLQRWLREEKRIEVNAFWDNGGDIWLGYAQEMDAPDLVGSFPLNKPFPTYELALEDALRYTLKNLV